MVEIVGQYTELRKAGANYSGRCPFHEERTPSFSVNPTEKLYYCFGCGAGGNLFGFVQAEGEPRLRRRRRVPRRQVRHRARVRGVERSRRCGASPPRAPARPARTGDGLLRAGAARRGGGGAGPRVPRRGAASATTSAAQFRSGLQPRPGWDKLRDAARAKRLQRPGPARRRPGRPGQERPALRPLSAAASCSRWPTTAAARSASARARMGDEKPKYLNSPETPLYHKSEAVFGLDKPPRPRRAREDRVYVVEGYTDVMALAQAGVRNVVASMGTALTEQQLKRLSRASRRTCTCASTPTPPASAPCSRALHAGAPQDGSQPCTSSASPTVSTRPTTSSSGAGGGRFSPRLPPRRRRCYNSTSAWRSRLTTSDKPDGRARAFARLRGSSAEAATPIERDEELRHIADRLQLSAESVRYLLAGAERTRRERAGRRRAGRPPPRARRGGGGRRRRPRPRGALPRRLSGAARQGPRRAGRPRRRLLRHRRDKGRFPRREAAIGA